MTIRIAVIDFPASNCNLDTIHVLNNVINVQTDLVWHNQFKESNYDGVVLPGGFSFGDSCSLPVPDHYKKPYSLNIQKFIQQVKKMGFNYY